MRERERNEKNAGDELQKSTIKSCDLLVEGGLEWLYFLYVEKSRDLINATLNVSQDVKYSWLVHAPPKNIYKPVVFSTSLFKLCTIEVITLTLVVLKSSYTYYYTYLLPWLLQLLETLLLISLNYLFICLVPITTWNTYDVLNWKLYLLRYYNCLLTNLLSRK